MTNFEKIKAMSVEEMAVFLFCDVWENEDYNTVIREIENPRGKLTVCYDPRDVQEWLESEVEEQ